MRSLLLALVLSLFFTPLSLAEEKPKEKEVKKIKIKFDGAEYWVNTESYNFGEVEKGKIYRAKQMDAEALEKFVAKHQIKTIITLHGNPPASEVEVIENNHLKLLAYPLSANREPKEETIKEILDHLKNEENHPILIHCAGGADRTGLIIALKRIEQDGWDMEKAKKEMLFYWHIPKLHPAMFRCLERRWKEKVGPPKSEEKK